MGLTTLFWVVVVLVVALPAVGATRSTARWMVAWTLVVLALVGVFG